MLTFLNQAPQHPLMVKERAGSSVRPLQLAYVLYGGRAAFERMVEIQAQFEADPVFDRFFCSCFPRIPISLHKGSTVVIVRNFSLYVGQSTPGPHLLTAVLESPV